MIGENQVPGTGDEHQTGVPRCGGQDADGDGGTTRPWWRWSPSLGRPEPFHPDVGRGEAGVDQEIGGGIGETG